ncbi:protease modulator HflC [Massilia solisilvae]|uniref:Protein HflC n=1 Tax=Massilia solisilvae TaxID=1811225 RepID=A0ABT2BFM8_9BURK|nr:protease modulator HflC [Massilia solisilvae]MCS0607319.1 protease modulator HflC [Massilia solisilvae]
MNRLVTVFVALFVALMLLSSTVFVVDQRRYAIVFALGEVHEVISEPGLHFKLPPPLQNVVYLDKRILTLDTPDGERYTTSEKKGLQVDAFVKWRIADPRGFFVSFGGDEGKVRDRVAQIVKAALNDEIARRTVHQVVSTERDKMMDVVRGKVVAGAKPLGLEVIDVRLKRVDFVDEINGAVFDRMKAERVRVANELRSTGSAESEKIKADADRQRTVILAEAYRDAEKIKGEGDARASEIYAKSFGKNPEFYKFYRSLEAYRASFKNHGDVMVIDSNSEFFKYFKNPGSGK